MDLAREKDPEQLRRIAQALEKEVLRLSRALTARSRELDELKGTTTSLQEALALLERARGRAEAASNEAASPKKEKAVQKGHGPTQQTSLPEVTKEYELDDADRVCPACGGELEEMAGQAEESEMVDVIDIQYQLVKVRRKKYRCACGSCVETAPGPERAVDGGRYSLRFATKVAEAKYLDHDPLERQCRAMKRRGLVATSQTLWDQVFALATLLRPNWERLCEELLKRPVIGLDQTGWPRLGAKNQKPWQMWALTAPGLAYHRICEDKSTATFVDIVGDFEGVIVCDALSTHAAGARASPGVRLAACWAHVQRRFADASSDFPQAQVALDAIAELYALDRVAEGDEARYVIRRERSSEILNGLHRWLLDQRFPKTTSLGGAIVYTVKLWPLLCRFTEDPRIPLDNNATERGLRGPVVGRKNHYGSKSRRGTEVASILYSLLETAKLQGVDPAAYLHDAVVAQKRFGHVLMPWDATDAA